MFTCYDSTLVAHVRYVCANDDEADEHEECKCSECGECVDDAFHVSLHGQF